MMHPTTYGYTLLSEIPPVSLVRSSRPNFFDNYMQWLKG